MAQGEIVNMVVSRYNQQPYPKQALPVLTYDDRMQIHFNDNEIELIHFSPAHTNGDTAVFFRKQNAVHLGDVFNNTGYPFIDADNGGTLDGLIAFCEGVLTAINEDTIVVPGHGSTASTAEFARYTRDLATIRDRLTEQVSNGLDLDEIIAAKLTSDFDETYGDNTMFINRAVKSLTYRYHP